MRERRAQLTHPDYQLGGDDDEELLRPLVPIYPASAAMPTWNIAKSVRLVLQSVEWPQDPLPEHLRNGDTHFKFREFTRLSEKEVKARVERPPPR